MKILVVEDDQMIREGICEYLSEFGYDMIEAKDGQEALLNFWMTLTRYSLSCAPARFR